MMAKQNQFTSNTNAGQSKQKNATSSLGQLGTEFASETDVQKVRQKNAASARNNQTQSQFQPQQSSFATEFSSETDAQNVRQKNQQAESRKAQNVSSNFGQQNQ
jgi:small acid-soluble spore protein E (minor gamma-type SASP)